MNYCGIIIDCGLLFFFVFIVSTYMVLALSRKNTGTDVLIHVDKAELER